MSKRPEPVMACAECGPVFSGYVTECRFCPGLPGHEVYWVDHAAGLTHYSLHPEFKPPVELLYAAAAHLYDLQDRIESMQQAQGGAKERRQGLKAARLATVIGERYSDPATVIPTLMTWQWVDLTDIVNERYGARHDPPSDETKALVAQKFAQPQEASDAL